MTVEEEVKLRKAFEKWVATTQTNVVQNFRINPANGLYRNIHLESRWQGFRGCYEHFTSLE